ncbi:hypothetical protein LSPH26S_01428 [Lysinibacillus sphaericus]
MNTLLLKNVRLEEAFEHEKEHIVVSNSYL